MNLLTVILTSYNENRDLLTKSLNSILCQTYESFRLIIIVEYKDQNYDIFQDFALKDPRVLVHYNNVRLGFAASLNKGIEFSNSKYIARIDSDDVCQSSRFEKQVRYLENHSEVDILG